MGEIISGLLGIGIMVMFCLLLWRLYVVLKLLETTLNTFLSRQSKLWGALETIQKLDPNSVMRLIHNLEEQGRNED